MCTTPTPWRLPRISQEMGCRSFRPLVRFVLHLCSCDRESLFSFLRNNRLTLERLDSSPCHDIMMASANVRRFMISSHGFGPYAPVPPEGPPHGRPGSLFPRPEAQSSGNNKSPRDCSRHREVSGHLNPGTGMCEDGCLPLSNEVCM